MAAAVVVTRAGNVPPDVSAPPIRILASANATAQLSIHDRPQLLTYTAAAQSAERALNQANIRLKKIDAFELDDKTAIDLILSLEAIGLSHPGQGWRTEAFRRIGHLYPKVKIPGEGEAMVIA